MKSSCNPTFAGQNRSKREGACELGSTKVRALTAAAVSLERKLGSSHPDVGVAWSWTRLLELPEQIPPTQVPVGPEPADAIGVLATAFHLLLLHDAACHDELSIIAVEPARCYVKDGDLSSAEDVLRISALEAARGVL